MSKSDFKTALTDYKAKSMFVCDGMGTIISSKFQISKRGSANEQKFHGDFLELRFTSLICYIFINNEKTNKSKVIGSL